MTDEEKEIEEWITERRKGSDLMSKLLLKNKELKKENAELKAKLNHTHCVECAREYLKEIGTLKAQIEQLSNDNHVLKTSFITQQEQIEKMKERIKEVENDSNNCEHWSEEQIEKYKTEKEYYEKLCHNKTIECDDLIKGIEQFQKDNEVLYKTVNEKNEQIEKMKCCWNCKFFKEKKYQACKDYKKNNTKCCAFYKWELAE